MTNQTSEIILSNYLLVLTFSYTTFLFYYYLMFIMDPYWEDSQINQVKIENTLPFVNGNSEDEDFVYSGKKKLSRDPLSHRIIEKRRRDRMNSCLADLSRLIPHEYTKKSRGRIEKTEVIEMAIRRIKHLTSRKIFEGSERRVEADDPILARAYKIGFLDCLNETIDFLVQFEGLSRGDQFCSQLKLHLANRCETNVHSDALRSRIDDKVTEENVIENQDNLNSSNETRSEINSSPTSSTSEKNVEPPSYKFKNRIQKRFEKNTEYDDRRPNRVPVFVLAPGGTHYLATWLEPKSIPGYVDSEITNEPSSNHHPVTISVVFGSKIGTT